MSLVQNFITFYTMQTIMMAKATGQKVDYEKLAYTCEQIAKLGTFGLLAVGSVLLFVVLAFMYLVIMWLLTL